MVRSPPRILALALACALSAQLALQACRVFVSAPLQTTRFPPRVALRAEAEEAGETDVETEEEEPPRPDFESILPDRGIDLDGDKLDNLEEWYQEGIEGTGGMPKGFLRDLILRSFYGTWKEVGREKYFISSREFTGPNMQPCATDYETAFENMRANIKENKNYLLSDDGKGWFWLVAGQNPGGLYIYLMKSPPWGERPLALIKEDNIDEFFDKVDWNRLYIRLHKWQLWGSRASTFPYPIVPGYWVKKTKPKR